MSKRLSFEERLDKCTSPLLRKLFQIIIKKSSTLCVAADFDSIEPTLRLIEQIGPHICMLKLHTEFHLRRQENLVDNLDKLCRLKEQYNFLLFEDRKFGDGGQTIQSAASGYFEYVDLVTVLPSFGDGIFEAIEAASRNVSLGPGEHRGCLAVCELSFRGVVKDDEQEMLEIAKRNSPPCIGIIAQKLNVSDPFSMIKATPGVNMSQKNDRKNQQWRGPEEVVADGADIIIVGRGITSQPEDKWESEAVLYKNLAFNAYLNSLK